MIFDSSLSLRPVTTWTIWDSTILRSALAATAFEPVGIETGKTASDRLESSTRKTFAGDITTVAIGLILTFSDLLLISTSELEFYYRTDVLIKSSSVAISYPPTHLHQGTEGSYVRTVGRISYIPLFVFVDHEPFRNYFEPCKAQQY
jgi:hypothetical protein